MRSQGKVQHGEGLVGRGSNTPERTLVIFKKADSEEWWKRKATVCEK